MKTKAIVIMALAVASSPVGAETKLEEAKRLFSLSIKQPATEKLKTRSKIARIAPNSSYGYFSRAYVLQSNRLYRAAEIISLYTSAIKKNPKMVAAYMNRASVYAAIGMRKAAMRDYTMAIRLRPSSKLAIFNRAVLMREDGDYSNALADYRRVILLEKGQRNEYSSIACYWIGALRAATKSAHHIFNSRCREYFPRRKALTRKDMTKSRKADSKSKKGLILRHSKTGMEVHLIKVYLHQSNSKDPAACIKYRLTNRGSSTVYRFTLMFTLYNKQRRPYFDYDIALLNSTYDTPMKPGYTRIGESCIYKSYGADISMWSGMLRARIYLVKSSTLQK